MDSFKRRSCCYIQLTNQSFTLPNTTTAIAFRYTGEWADNWFIDNITVGQCTADVPVSVSTPIAPLDAATDVPILIDGDSSLVNFQWPADADVGSYTLNVSTSLTGFPNIGSLTIGANFCRTLIILGRPKYNILLVY